MVGFPQQRLGIFVHTHFFTSMTPSCSRSLKRDCTNMLPFSCRPHRRTIQMLLENQMSFKMATNGYQSSASDFSIDHILNRAGERFLNKRQSVQYDTLSMRSSGSSGDESNGFDSYDRGCGFSENERFMEIPAFDWLNYTRYNMPRIPRKFHCEPQARTSC